MTQVYQFTISPEMANDPDTLKHVVRDRLDGLPVDLSNVVVITVQPVEGPGRDWVEVRTYSSFDERYPVARVVFGLVRKWARTLVSV